MDKLVIKGLPHSIATDAWWFTETTDPAENGAANARKTARPIWAPVPAFILAILVALADFLFWQHAPGLSLIVFSGAIHAAALLSLRPMLTTREWRIWAAVWLACALPVFELVQFTSLLFLGIGHTGLLVWCATRSTGTNLTRKILWLPCNLVSFAILTTIDALFEFPQSRNAKPERAAIQAWILPLFVGAIFLALFWGANPVLDIWLRKISGINFTQDSLNRLLFWIMIAALVLPIVFFKGFAAVLSRTSTPVLRQRNRQGRLINARSITNSLVLFNAMFMIQNLTDITILWGGAGLPGGITYASYAHRGAYPLMTTSIMAGLFALVSRPYVEDAAYLKSLLLLWVLQNVVLLGSALMRLDLYVAAYGLTYLRVRAGIGMLLVLTGLILLIWQLWKGKSNLWITSIFGAVFAATLYIGSFINFGYVIAATNLSRSDAQTDYDYLYTHTQNGIKALVDHAGKIDADLPCQPVCHWHPAPEGWRDWNFREARLSAHRQNYAKQLNAQQRGGRDTPGTTP